MTAFEKELEAKIKELLDLELEEKDGQKTKPLDFLKTETEIQRLEQLAHAFEEGKVRIENKIRELKGMPIKSREISEQKLEEIIKEAVKKEIQKKTENMTTEQENRQLEKDLILSNAIVKREMKSSKNTKDSGKKTTYEKSKNIKDYQKLSATSTQVENTPNKESEKMMALNKKELKVKSKLLGSYWNVTHPDLLFTSTVIEDVAQTFTQKDFKDLDAALSELNNNLEIKRKKISPESEDYYLSFRIPSGVKSRIFYQMMPEEFGKKRMVITRIVKQYHLRSVE